MIRPLLVLALGLALAGPASAADPEPELIEALSTRPDDVLLRLDLGRALARSEEHAQEARLGLEALLAEPGVSAAARTALVDLCLIQPPQIGWIRTYESLLNGAWPANSEARRARLQLRLAQASVEDPTRRAKAVRELETLGILWPSEIDPPIGQAHAALLDGDVDRAQAALAGVPDRAEAARYHAIVALAKGAPAADLANLAYAPAAEEVAVDGLINLALQGPTPARNARAMYAAGYDELAIQLLKNTEPDAAFGLPEDDEVLRELATILLDSGRVREASRAWARLLALRPHDPTAKVGLATALWEEGKYAKALETLPEVESPESRVLVARHMIRDAAASSDRSDDQEAINRGYELAPGAADVALAKARLLVNMGKHAEAVLPLRIALDDAPADPEALELWVRASIKAGQDPLPEVRRALSMVTGRDARRIEEILVLALKLGGEKAKFANDQPESERLYTTGVLVAPDDAGVLGGLGGLKWQMGELEHARRAYVSALRLSGDAWIVEALVGLSLSQGDLEGARDWLAKARNKRDPTIRALYVRIELEAELQEARRYRKIGEPERALPIYERLRSTNPDSSSVVHEHGDALLEAGHAEKALATYAKAQQIDPGNLWAVVGEANALAELGRLRESRARLDELQEVEDPELARQLVRVRAGIYRVEGDTLKAAGDHQGAYKSYMKAMEMVPDTWSVTALGWLYLEHRQYAAAMGTFEEALELDSKNQVAKRGRIFALEAAGNIAQASEEARALAEAHPSQENRDLIGDLRFQSDLRRALAARDRGNLVVARDLLDELDQRRPDDPGVGAARAAVMLEQGQARQALELAEKVMGIAPNNAMAASTLLSAAHELGEPEKVEPVLERAAEAGASANVQEALEIARLRTRLFRAKELANKRARARAMELMREAERSAAGRVDHLSLVAGAYLDLQAPLDALRVFDEALKMDASYAEAVLGRAGTLRALGRSKDSDLFVSTQFEKTGNPGIGLAWAEALGDQGRKRKANEALDTVEEMAKRKAPTNLLAQSPLPLATLPSGRTLSEPMSGDSPEWAVDTALQERIDDLRRDLDKVAPPHGAVAGGLLFRPGEKGEQQLSTAFLIGGLHELRMGPLNLSAEVMLVSLNNGAAGQTGAAMAIGLETSPQLAWGLSADVGISPAGMVGDPYITWYAQGRGRIGDAFVGVESGRAPATDSLMAWSGVVDADQRVYGRVVRTWAGGYVRVPNGPRQDIGGSLRGGWLDVRGYTEPVPYADGSLYAYSLVSQGAHDIRVGGEGVFNTYAMQLDGFTAGQAGAFTPPLFVAALARVQGDLELDQPSLWASWRAGIGPQYMAGEDSIYFGAGAHVAADFNGSISTMIGERARGGLDVRYQVTVGSWYQVSTMLRVDFVPRRDGPRPQRQHALSPTFGDGIVTSQAARPR